MEKRINPIPIRRALPPEDLYFGVKKQKKSYIKPLVLACSVGLLTLLSFSLPGTYSHLTSSSSMQASTFKATTITDYLSVSPGSSSANVPIDGQNIQNLPIYSYKVGNIEMEFGEVTVNTSANFPSTLKLENLTTKPLTIVWNFEGDIATVFSPNNTKFILEPNGANTVTVYQSVSQSVYGTGESSNYEQPQYSNPYFLGFATKTSTPAGQYQGFLTLTINGNFLSQKIPAKIVIKN